MIVVQNVIAFPIISYERVLEKVGYVNEFEFCGGIV